MRYAFDLKIRSEDISPKERAIREYLFWSDKTSKICTRLQLANREHVKIERLVKALLDKRNDDKVKDKVHFLSILLAFSLSHY
jgi:hypothetical protein